jgi:hypothetical protein
MEDDKTQLATLVWRNVTTAHLERWRKALERLGPEGVRSRLSQATSFDPDEMIEIDDTGDWPSRKFVEDWLAEVSVRARRPETRRFWVTVVLGTIAAVSSCIAALPVVEPFIRR